MTKADLQKKWTAIISDYRSSGQTQTAFCKSEGISLRQLSYWLRKEGMAESLLSESHQWVAVEVDHKTSTCEKQSVQIRLGYAEIEVKPGFDKKHLLDVIAVLKQLC